MDNIPDIAPLTYGVICLGCPVVLPSVNSTRTECDLFLRKMRPDFAICEIEFYQMLKECFRELNINAKIFTTDGQADDSIPIQSLYESINDEDTDFE